MKIGELFVALSFKVDGQGDLAKAYNDVQNLGKASGALALGIGAMSAGFIAMISSSASAGNALKNFQITTGLSAKKLQQWQHFAKQAVNSSEMIEPQVVKMQRKMADAMLSNNFTGLSGWTIFGLDPSADPFEMLDRLNTKFKTMTDPKDLALFGRLLQDLGMDDRWMAIFRRSWTGKGLSDNLIQNQKEIDNLDTMAVKIRTIKSEAEHAANSFSSLFGPAVDDVTTRVDSLLQEVGRLSKELNNGTPESETKKAVLNTGTEVVVGTGLGLGALATATKVLRLLGVTGATTGSVIGSVGRLSPYLALTAALVDKGMDLGEVASGRGGRNFGEKFNTIIKPPFWDPLNRAADKIFPWAHMDWPFPGWRGFSNPRGFDILRGPGSGGGQSINTTINVVNPASHADGTLIGTKAAEAFNARVMTITAMGGAPAGSY